MGSKGDSTEGSGDVPAVGWEVPHVQRAPDAPRDTPPGTFSAPKTAGAEPSAPAARGGPHRLDLATAATVLAALPLMVLSFFVVLLVLFVIDVCLGAIDL